MSDLVRFNQLWHLTRALFMEVTREPGVLFWGILFPILMSLGLGLAFTKKTDTLRRVAIINNEELQINDTTGLRVFLDSRCEENLAAEKDTFQWKFVMKDQQLGNSTFLFYRLSWNDATVLLKRGRVSLIIQSINNITEYHFDPMNSDAELAYLLLSTEIGSGRIPGPDEGLKIMPLTVTGTRYIDFLVPGLIAMGVMMSSMWGISYGIIEKRSKKLLRRLVATPMKKSHFLIALITVRVIMNYIEAAVLLVFSLIVFKIKIQGDITALALFFLAGNIAFSGLAVFVSSHTSNTEVGNGLINLVVMPMMVLSGIFFSYHNFPDWSTPVIRNLPLTILADGTRSIFNEGAGYPEIAVPLVILSTIGILFFLAGLKIFKWH